jgi:hypothetical protein
VNSAKQNNTVSWKLPSGSSLSRALRSGRPD